jgi:hypothetical protein
VIERAGDEHCFDTYEVTEHNADLRPRVGSTKQERRTGREDDRTRDVEPTSK